MVDNACEEILKLPNEDIVKIYDNMYNYMWEGSAQIK
jgi:hypothetical protein